MIQKAVELNDAMTGMLAHPQSVAKEVDGVWRVEAFTPTPTYVVRVIVSSGLFRSLRAALTGTNEH